jgi:hypothetical protein
MALPHLLLMEKPQTLKQHEDLEHVQGKLRKYDLGDGGNLPHPTGQGHGKVIPD